MYIDMEKPLTKNIRPDRTPMTIKEYEMAGGYQALHKALTMSPQDLQQKVRDGNLKGRGGAGFKTGVKWGFVPMGPDAPRPKYLAMNADEMEPGTIKDRLLLEGDPNSVVESSIIIAYAIGADIAYIFIRWDYQLAAARVEKAIAEAYQRGYLGKNILKSGYSLDMYVHTSAGRYMCGEENGLLDALEGRRPIPRAKPPYPQTCGFWGKPTVVENIETACNVPHIVLHGPEWFKSLSRTDEGGTKIYSMSGRIKRTGPWELPMGTPIREILEEHAGGMQEGYKFRALLPGGASTEFVTEEHLDTPMDFNWMMKIGSHLGTGTMIVLDDKTCPVGMINNLQQFFSRESCGWCTPCREGLPWVSRILQAIEDGRGEPRDLDILSEHTWLLQSGHTFCALAPGAMFSLESGLKYFREDFERHITEHRCPWRK
jgi:NADH-quinone oxidoreductase subunit F